jgi:hypothetical protein
MMPKKERPRCAPHLPIQEVVWYLSTVQRRSPIADRIRTEGPRRGEP